MPYSVLPPELPPVSLIVIASQSVDPASITPFIPIAASTSRSQNYYIATVRQHPPVNRVIPSPVLPKPLDLQPTVDLSLHHRAGLLGPPLAVGSSRVDLSLIPSSGDAGSGTYYLAQNQTLAQNSIFVERLIQAAVETQPIVQDVPAVPPTQGNEAIANPNAPFKAGNLDVVELTADRQEYDDQRRIFKAEGNVSMRVRGALLDAEFLRINFPNQFAVAEGQVALTRGEQILRGDRFEYNFVQGIGTIFNASGEIYQRTLGRDVSPTLPSDLGSGTITTRPLSDRITRNQPLQQVASPGGLSVAVGVGRDAPLTGGAGEVNRLRFQAERLDFTPEGWQARDIRITNDPFSPPELELRADEAKLTRTSPTEQVVETSQPRLVFDQGFSLPILQSRAVLDAKPRRNVGFFNLGYDGGDRGGVFIEQTVEPIFNDQLQWSLTPQFYIQRTVEGSGKNLGQLFGVISQIKGDFGTQTSLRGNLTLTSLDFSQVETNLRASLRLRQLIDTHTLGLEYSYRDRLFNGSLGFQEVQSTFGAILTSPLITVGNTGINLSYQAALQSITADTDRLTLLAPIRPNNRTSLSRLQTSLALSRGFTLWQGEPLPPTAPQGLRFTPTPLVPYLQLAVGLTGVTGFYSNGDNQETLTGSLRLQAQLGYSSRPFFDYTGLNIEYSQTARSGFSPFLFDRAVDNKVLSGGIIQQVYGPLRAGFQTSINLDTGKEISTDYILEYSRRTYGIILRYNPILQIGSLGLRISDFNWEGGTDPFSGAGIRAVESGVIRSND